MSITLGEGDFEFYMFQSVAAAQHGAAAMAGGLAGGVGSLLHILLCP